MRAPITSTGAPSESALPDPNSRLPCRCLRLSGRSVFVRLPARDHRVLLTRGAAERSESAPRTRHPRCAAGYSLLEPMQSVGSGIRAWRICRTGGSRTRFCWDALSRCSRRDRADRAAAGRTDLLTQWRAAAHLRTASPNRRYAARRAAGRRSTMPAEPPSAVPSERYRFDGSRAARGYVEAHITTPPRRGFGHPYPALCR